MEDNYEGLRLASFDGGKGKAISQLEIICNLMHRLKMTHYANDSREVILPCEVFDLMGGCDTGGLIVIMLTRLEMSADETRVEFTKLCNDVFDVRNMSPSNKSARLRSALEDLLVRKDIPLDAKLNDGKGKDKRCPGFVVTLPRSSLTGKILFRTYDSRIAPPSSVTILDAALATCASQPEFLPVVIAEGDNVREEYLSAIMGAANPVHNVVTEAFHYFPTTTKVSSIVSFGCGYPSVVQLPTCTSKDERFEAYTQISEDCEKVAQKLQEEVSGLDIYFRLSVTQGVQRSVPLAYADGERDLIVSFTSEYLQDPEIDTLLERCVDCVHLRRGVRSIEYLAHRGGKLPTHKAIPALSTSFIAREEPYNELVRGVTGPSSASRQSIVVVSGMAGCGKTQLVVSFAHEHGTRFKHIFFIDGSSRTSIMRDLVTYVQNADSKYSQATFEEALDFLQDPLHSNHIVIYDNVDDVDLDLRDLIPKARHGCIIITTRNRTLGMLASEPSSSIELDVMSEKEAVQAMLKSSRLPSNDASDRIVTIISQKLGYLPVALIQAGSYIAEVGCTPEEYLELLEEHLSELMDIPAVDLQQRGAYATFDIAYKKLPQPIQNFLHILSFLHYANFPMASIATAVKNNFRYDPHSYVEREPLFEQAIEVLRSTFTSSGSWNALALNKMIVTMRKFSLATFTEGFNTRLLRIHLLCHSWANARIQDDRKALFVEAAIRLVVCGAQEPSLEQYLISHVEALFPGGELSANMCINDYAVCGDIFQNQGILDISVKIWQTTYAVVCEHTGVNSSLSRGAGGYLAQAFQRQGDYDNAEKIQKLLVESFRSELGEDDMETVAAKGELAITYQYQGRYAEAIELAEQVLQKRRESDEANDATTILTESNLAHMYFSLGRYSEAEKLQLEALKRYTEVSGPFHRYTLSMKDNLAKTYSAQDRLTEAEKLQVEVVDASKKHLGPTHPDTLVSMANLADTYAGQERYKEAEELRVLVFEGQKEKLGATHPRTLSSMDNLASTYSQMNRISDARRLQEEVVALYTETLGPTHPDTLIAMSNLAGSCFEMEEYETAEQLQSRVVVACRETVGITHPNTLSSMGHLSKTYRTQGRFEEARVFDNLMVEAYKVSLGETHPQTLGAMFNLAVTYRGLNKLKEAEEVQVHVLKYRKQRFGPLHQATMNALQSLARTYSDQNKYAEAAEIEAEIVEVCKTRSGEDHPETATAMMDLGVTYYYLNRFDEAEQIVSSLLKRYRENLGFDHPVTKSAITNLAAIYKAQGREKEAKKLKEE
ncbi:hypothetical protein FRB91_008869 [Serendipita sp. 411]|nr:hypothetical protein FRB91_008869 [Serendipita sp. 411]